MVVMGAWGTEMPLQDLMGYMRIDLTVAAGSSELSPPPRRIEEMNDAAFSMGERRVEGANEATSSSTEMDRADSRGSARSQG